MLDVALPLTSSSLIAEYNNTLQWEHVTIKEELDNSTCEDGKGESEVCHPPDIESLMVDEKEAGAREKEKMGITSDDMSSTIRYDMAGI